MNRGEGCSVAYFTDASYTGGAEKYILHLARGIISEGFTPHVIFDENSSAEKLRDWLTSSSIPFTEMSLYRNRVGGRFFQLNRQLRHLAPRILHINLPGPFDADYGFVALAGRLAGIRSIVTTEHLPMYPSFFKSRVLKGLSGIWIDRVITVSEDNRGHLVENHGTAERKIRVIYNGVPDPLAGKKERDSYKVDGGRFNMVIVGSLEERKGHFDAIRLMEKLGGRFHLYIAGEGPLEGPLKEKVSDKGLTERITFTGHVRNVDSLLSRMDMLIHPTHLDATPYVILEAMAHGIPVVASGIFGIKEMVDQNSTGILVSPGDIEEMAGAVRMIEGDETLHHDMSVNARKRFEEMFTLAGSVKKTAELYRELVGQECRKAGRSV